MAGALAGAFMGADFLKKAWLEKIESRGSLQRELAEKLMDITINRMNEKKQIINFIESLE